MVRRVVTGHDADGRSVFVSDGPVEPIIPMFTRVWATDELPTFPDDGSDPIPPGTVAGFFPAQPGGIRFWMFTLEPHSSGRDTPDDPAVAAQVEAILPGMGAVMDPTDPGMHTTDTIDLEVVLSGTVTLELDDGAEKEMGPGDIIIQNGTRHRWHNRGDERAVMAAILIGAHRAN